MELEVNNNIENINDGETAQNLNDTYAVRTMLESHLELTPCLLLPATLKIYALLDSTRFNGQEDEILLQRSMDESSRFWKIKDLLGVVNASLGEIYKVIDDLGGVEINGMSSPFDFS